MRTDIGRFLEPWIFETQTLIKATYDLALGAGKDVEAFIEGRELVFARGEATPPGFLRVLPAPTSVMLSFPKGASLFDPKKVLSGYPTSRRRVTLYTTMDLDLTIRRFVDAAYHLDEPKKKDPWDFDW